MEESQPKRQRIGESKEKKKRNTRKDYKRLLNSSEMGGFMAQKGLCNLAKEKIMKARGELPDEEGDAVREHEAMHEENFWSSWPREDERTARAERNEEEGEKRKREEEKEENQTETVKRRCEGLVSVEAF